MNVKSAVFLKGIRIFDGIFQYVKRWDCFRVGDSILKFFGKQVKIAVDAHVACDELGEVESFFLVVGLDDAFFSEALELAVEDIDGEIQYPCDLSDVRIDLDRILDAFECFLELFPDGLLAGHARDIVFLGSLLDVESDRGESIFDNRLKVSSSLEEFIWILVFPERDNEHVEILVVEVFETGERRFDPGLVVVETEIESLGESLDEVDVLLGEGGPADPDGVSDACLME